MGLWNDAQQVSSRVAVKPAGQEPSPVCSADATYVWPKHADGVIAVSGWNSAMESCKKSKPTITMRNSSKKEHIYRSAIKIETPGKVQFSVKKCKSNPGVRYTRRNRPIKAKNQCTCPGKSTECTEEVAMIKLHQREAVKCQRNET